MEIWAVLKVCTRKRIKLMNEVITESMSKQTQNVKQRQLYRTFQYTRLQGPNSNSASIES